MKKLMMIAACAAALAGCQTRITWEKYPATQGGGWCVTARSQLRGFRAEVATNGTLSVEINAYERDLSTNAVTMTKTIFDGSANLALAVAKAYATIQTGGASAALVGKVVDYFKAKGGDAAKSTVTSDGSTITVTDGTTCISCDAAGNCTDCTKTGD